MTANNTIAIQSFKSPVGELLIGSYKGKLCLCDWTYRRMRKSIDRRLQTTLKATYVEQPCDTTQHAISQLNRYFTKGLQQFDLPLLMVGTNFQQQVWSALLNIPYAETASYSELAQNIHNKKAIRAVANANGANAISIIIPCHRVIGSKGELTGYAGGLATKKRLLALEKT